MVQHAKGYRFGLDALLLATDLPPLPENAEIVDLGAGQGAVSCVIAAHNPDVCVTGIERQEGLSELFRQNVKRNGLGGRVRLVETDLRNRSNLRSHIADLVVSNPPYHEVGGGQKSPNLERAEAHQEWHGGIHDFVGAAQYLAKPGGYLKVVLPPKRLGAFRDALNSTDFGLQTLRFFHSTMDTSAYLFEALARRGTNPELEVLPPLVIYGLDGEYGSEVCGRIQGPT